MFLLTNTPVSNTDNYQKHIRLGNYDLYYNTRQVNEFLLLENKNWMVFSDANEAFIHLLKESIKKDTDVAGLIKEESFKILDAGFVLLHDKNDGSIRIISGFTGIYPLYYSTHGKTILVSNTFFEIIKRTGKRSIDSYALLDFLLFNYTLKDRTLARDVFQLRGGTELIIEKNGISLSDIDHQLSGNASRQSGGISPADLRESFTRSLSENIATKLPVVLALSGGFDSRLNLAALFNLKKKFTSYTFGAENSLDPKTAIKIARKFNLKHRFFDLNSNYFNNIESYIQPFIQKAGNNPILLDLIHYEFIFQSLEPSNIITGFMGGEFISGPVVISEVIMTRSAAHLTSSVTEEVLNRKFRDTLKKGMVFNQENAISLLPDYLDTLKEYQFSEAAGNKLNLVDFMIRETYAKFFGTVYNVMFSRFNIISPFTDMEFLEQLLRSKYRFTKNRPFTKNPLAHFNSRKLYAKMIRDLSPDLVETYIDRGYQIKDLLSIYAFPKSVVQYILNHYFKINKVEHLKTLNYTKWFKELVISVLKDSDILHWDLLNGDEITKLIIMLKQKKDLPDYVMRRLIQLLGLHYYNKEITKINI